MHPFLNIAQRAAFNAGKIMLRHIDRLDTLKVNSKQRNDFVTEVDLKAEREIIGTLSKIYPDHGFLGEESGTSGEDAEYRWIIDPVDGTTNYVHGFPHFAVSIGLQHKGRLEAGLIYDPVKQETFTATRGQGAQLNDRRIRVRSQTTLEGALLSTGMPFSQIGHLAEYLAIMGGVMQAGGQVRRSGSAALDLAYVAAGRLDGVWALGLKPWDLAAGVILIQEAGGLVGDLAGGNEFMQKGNVVTGNPKLFKALLQTIHPHLSVELGN